MSHVSVGVMKGAWVKVGVTQKKGSDYKSGGRFLRRNQSCWKMKKTERTLKSRTNQRCLCTIVLFLFVGSTQTHTHSQTLIFPHTHTHNQTAVFCTIHTNLCYTQRAECVDLWALA